MSCRVLQYGMVGIGKISFVAYPSVARARRGAPVIEFTIRPWGATYDDHGSRSIARLLNSITGAPRRARATNGYAINEKAFP